MKPYLRDTRLWLFILLAFGASIISSHGAFQFFKYLVDNWLAWVFILVVALGIIGLDVAGTIERGRRALAYYAGMAFFLVLETLANYFAGQAGFVAQIVAKLPATSDLRTIAETAPLWTRVLVVLFLSLASLAVAFFAFAATTRFQQIRNGVEGSAVAWLRRVLGQRRALVKTIVRALALERRERRKTMDLLRQSANQDTLLRSELSEARSEIATVRNAAKTVTEESARQANENHELKQSLRIKEHELSTEREKSAGLRKDIDRQSAEIKELSATLALDVRSIAAALRDDSVPLRTIAAALGVSEKTIRNWTAEKVEV